MRRRPLLVATLAAAVIALVASATVAVGVGTLGGPSPVPSMMPGGVGPGGSGYLPGSSPAAPNLPGTVVNVSLTDMGGPMMGQSNAMMGQGQAMMNAGAMRLSADQATVPHGTVSFLVTNAGSMNHEMVVLPLADTQVVGTRPIGADAKIDEAGSLGEASKTGREGAGQGVVPGAASWLTITLAPGRYELVCNLPDHYTAGMHTQLTVT